MSEIEFYDIIIVGGGFAGLSAANYFSSKSVKYILIEERERVGGRTLSKNLVENNCIIDLGGQWISPKQKRILSLINKYNLQLIEQTWYHHYPNHLGEILGLKSLNKIQLENITKINFQWDQMALQLHNVQNAFQHENASQWATISLQQFIQEHPLANDIRIKQELNLQILTLTATNAENVSLLYWLILIRSIPGGLNSLDDGINGAQHYKISSGSQDVCFHMSIGINIHLNDPVELINYQLNNKILLQLKSGLQIQCQRLLLAFSPTLLSKINFIPQLSFSSSSCSMIMGQCIKTILIYSKPFWRNSSINQCEYEGPCSNIFESTNPICLIGLILGKEALYWNELNENDLIEAIRKQYSILYKIDEKPLKTFIQYWTKEDFSKGCYSGIYPSSLLSTWLDRTKPLIDNQIWLASTEMALEWIGYIEGACEAGERFAQQIIHSLQL